MVSKIKGPRNYLSCCHDLMATGRADRAPSQQGEAGRLSTHTHTTLPPATTSRTWAQRHKRVGMNECIPLEEQGPEKASW